MWTHAMTTTNWRAQYWDTVKFRDCGSPKEGAASIAWGQEDQGSSLGGERNFKDELIRQLRHGEAPSGRGNGTLQNDSPLEATRWPGKRAWHLVSPR